MIAMMALLGLDSLFGSISDGLLQLALPALATAAATLLVGLLKRGFAYMKIQITAEQEAALREKVRNAILRIEELSKQDPKTPMKGEDKLDSAIVGVMNETGVGAMEAEKLIHEELPKARVMWPPKIGAR